MKLVVEISLYPLTKEYIEPIQAFIDRLNKDTGLQVNTSRTNTVVEGECNHVMQVLNTEMQKTYAQVGQAIFVCKFLNGDKMSGA